MPIKNSERAKESRVLRWAAVVSPACISAERSIVCLLALRFRSRAGVTLENLALRHQLHVLRRQRPGRPRLFTIDRLLWVLLYQSGRRRPEVMVLVEPGHRRPMAPSGVPSWRWRSRSGRPCVDREIRDLIRQMSGINPLWGAPRIHGELLDSGSRFSQATVAKYMVRRRGTPSQNWRTFLSNHAEGIAATDMFVVASASCRLLSVIIILAHDRRKIVGTAVTEHPTAACSRATSEAFRGTRRPGICCVIATRRMARTSVTALQ